MKTARFWDYSLGLVKIKISAGQTVYHTRGGATDEGWSRESRAYSFDGQTVTYEWCTDGVDCDGRLIRSGICHCPIDRLAAGYVDTEEGVTFPDWQTGETSQRDHSAEAAGY